MNGERSYHRVSDTLLKWVLGLVGAGLVSSIGLLLDIRFKMAAYEARQNALDKEVEEVKTWQRAHDEHDRQRFQALEGRR